MNQINLLTRCFTLAAVVAAAVAGLTSPAAAQEYPTRVITGIIPFAVGGSTDLSARFYATYLSKELGQSIILENKPGASANIGINYVVKSRPADGYTILFAGIAPTQNPALIRNLGYDPATDLQPVVWLSESPWTATVNAKKFPNHTFLQFLDEIRKAPGKFNASSSGVGTQLIYENMRMEYGLKFEIIKYASAGEEIAAVIGGEGDFMVVDPSLIPGPVAAKQVRALVIAGPERLPAFPDVPTAAEAGVPSFINSLHFGLYVRGGTPKPIIDKLYAVLTKINAMPEVQKQLGAWGQTAVRKTTQEYVNFYNTDIARWKRVVKEANIPTLD